MATREADDELALFCKNPLRSGQFIYLNETSSTNIVAMEHGCKGAMAGTVVVAEAQTEGRGRLGKEWLSHAGYGLYMSIILRPKLELAYLSQITLAAGVALAQTAARYTVQKPMLKWPNDLIVGGRKCAGILAESDVRNVHSPLVVLGIGVNMYQPRNGYGVGLQDKAGAVNDFTDSTISRCVFLKQLIQDIRGCVQTLEDGKFQDILKCWRDYDYTVGKKMVWVTTAGTVVRGVCEGIDDEGLLYVTETNGSTHKVLSGDVQLVGNVK